MKTKLLYENILALIRNLSFHLINVVISGEFPAKTERLLLKYW